MSKKRMQPEKIVENQILNLLKNIGIFCWKTDRVGTYDPVRKTFRTNHNVHKIKGVSDILGLVAGRLLAIEVKSETGRLSDEQRSFIVRINEEQGLAFVARSTQDVVRELSKHFPEIKGLKEMAIGRMHLPQGDDLEQ